MSKEEKPEPTPDLATSAAAMAAAMREMVQEMKAMHSTLKAIARSQAQLATKQQGKGGGHS